MKASRLRILCAEIYKSINSINLSFKNEIFRSRVTIEWFVFNAGLILIFLKLIKLALVIKAYDFSDLKFRILSRLT